MGRLAEAFGMLRRQKAFSELQLVLVVSSKFHRQIREELARQPPDLSGVVFASNMSDEDLAYLYSRAALFAYVSLYECFGLPPLEAMAAGCPVVASNATSVPEVVGDAGLYVDPLDTQSIASAMAEMLSDEGLRQRMIEKGKAQASAFTWAHTFERTVEFYRELAQAART